MNTGRGSSPYECNDTRMFAAGAAAGLGAYTKPSGIPARSDIVIDLTSTANAKGN